MRFSVCVIEPEGYKYTHFLYDICKYICYGIESAGYDCCILRNKLTADRTNIIVGAHNQRDPALVEAAMQAGKYILFQSEIITDNLINNQPAQKSFADVYLPLMQQAQAVWTTVESNIDALKKWNVEADPIFWGYHPLMEEIHHKSNKDIDFLFCGSITPHRKKLLEQLIARGGRVVVMFDDAAMFRNDLIARTRVNLAPNQGPGMNHFGGVRVMYLIGNRSIVVVERCHDQAMFEHCFPWAETERWVDLCMETLRRPDLNQITEEYYEKAKSIRMVDFLTPLLDKFLSGCASHAPAGKAAHAGPLSAQQNAALNENHPSPHFKEKPVPGLVSIVIFTHNRLDQTKKCVKSIFRHTPETHEIVFVDNGSTDGTVKWLQGQIRKNKNCFLIENSTNVGQVKGRNQGMEASRGEFIVLLNNDVAVAQGWLSAMLDCLNRAPDAGIVGPTANHAGGIQKVTDPSYRSVEYLDSYASRFQEQFRHRRILLRKIDGFCMLFRRALVERIGMPDEQFESGGFEDDDYCLRSALAGFRTYIAGDVFIHRFESEISARSASAGKNIFEQKWTLSTRSAEGKRLSALKATELADALCQHGKPDKAIEVLIDCIKIAPDAAEIYESLTRIFIESKRFSEAREVIASMPEEAKDGLRGLELAGYAKEGLGLDDEAAEYADRMLAMDDASAPALNLRGILAYKQGDRKAAESWFRKATDADPGYGEAWTNLGVLEWSGERRDAAVSNLRRGFALAPAVPDHGSLYYAAITALNRFDEAENELRHARSICSGNKDIAFLLIEALIRQNKLDAAMPEIEDAITAFGLDEGMLEAALSVRERLGPRRIDNRQGKKGTLSLCMIVKNEEKNLARCLRSVRGVVDEMIVVDTGSSDKTMDIARIFGALVFEFPWTGDFSEARNQSLAHAEGDWILVLDADEVIAARDYDELKTLARKKPSSPVAYSIITRNYTSNVSVIGWTRNNGEFPEEAGAGWVKSFKVRLFPRRKDVFFANAVHEIVEDSLNKARIPIRRSNILVHHYGKLDMEREAQKGLDYYTLGKMKYESDPTNVKYINELAKQAHLLHKYEEAAELWLKLLSLIGTDPRSPGYREIAQISYGEPLPEIYIQLASAYLMMDRYDAALEAATRAMSSRTKLKECVHIYAHCEIIVGAPDKALRALEELLADMPDYLPALFLTTVIFCLKGKTEEMRERLQLLLQKRLQITPLLNDIASQLHSHGKRNEALLILNATVENKLSDEETGRLIESIA